MTQQELAKRMRVSRSTIANYEHSRAAPPPPVLRDLSRVLGCRPKDFLDESGRGLSVLRSLAGLSQKDVLERLDSDLTLSTYQKLEQGRVRRLRRADAEDLARVLGVSVDEVIEAHGHDIRRREVSTTEEPAS